MTGYNNHRQNVMQKDDNVSKITVHKTENNKAEMGNYTVCLSVDDKTVKPY